MPPLPPSCERRRSLPEVLPIEQGHRGIIGARFASHLFSSRTIVERVERGILGTSPLKPDPYWASRAKILFWSPVLPLSVHRSRAEKCRFESVAKRILLFKRTVKGRFDLFLLKVTSTYGTCACKQCFCLCQCFWFAVARWRCVVGCEVSGGRWFESPGVERCVTQYKTKIWTGISAFDSDWLLLLRTSIVVYNAAGCWNRLRLSVGCLWKVSRPTWTWF